MSNRARALILGATLVAMNLASMTAVAQANDEPTSTQDARRPPTEAQVGEAWRHRQVPSTEQTTADAALRRQLARERFSIPNGTPAQAPAPTQADEPNGQPGWVLASLGGLAAVLALIAGLVVLAIRRAGRRARVGHAA
jgi:hypothetical protein